MIDVLKAVAEQWDRSLVHYAVASGLEGYPERLGRDVDVVVDRRHLQAASVAVRSVLERRGWCVVVRKRAELVQHFCIGPSRSESLIIDLFPGLRWGPVWLVERPAASDDIDGFRVDPWVSFVKRVLLHVLVAPRPKFSGRPERLQLSEAERSAASTRLPRLLGPELAARLLATVQQQDFAGLEALRPQLRKALVVSAVREAPLRTLRTAVQWAATRVTIATSRPAMPMVGIVGPDGVGKTSVLTEVVRQAQERLRCPYVAVRPWRPGILPQFGTYFAEPSRTTDVAPRRSAGRLGLATYYALDFLLGHVLLDRRVSADLGLVVYERGALDMYVDPVRYGLASGWRMRLLVRVLPQPDLVVLLYDDPDRVRGCKAQLEKEEIKRQLDLWMRLADEGAVHMVLKVDTDPSMLAKRIVGRLVDLFVRRNCLQEAGGIRGIVIGNHGHAAHEFDHHHAEDRPD